MTKRIFFILFVALCARSAFAVSEAELDSLYNDFRIDEVEVLPGELDRAVQLGAEEHLVLLLVELHLDVIPEKGVGRYLYRPRFQSDAYFSHTMRP